MAEKSEELSNPNSCLNKAAPNEPIFILRAQDAFAPMIVRIWAYIAAVGGASGAKTSEARNLADRMEDWPTRKQPD